MNIVKLLCLLMCSPIFLSLRPAFGYIEQNTAVLRIMDKAAGKTRVVSAQIGQTVQNDGLKIVVRNCKKTDAFQAENYFAFIEVYTKSNDRIFSGWMNRNEPGQNPLQNDTYDLWIEKCE